MTNSVVTNRDLFDRTVHGLDDLYVVTKPPQPGDTELKIVIALDDEAVVLDKCQEDYPAQRHTVSQIRSGLSDQWLLSGGALILDEVGRIAVGMRDGNAADPFAYTNIAAGRCDQRFEAHCYEEFASEFILCVKQKNDNWEQICFGESTPHLASIRKMLPTIAKWKGYVSSATLKHEILRPSACADLPGLTSISIYWQDNGVCRLEEHLRGFVLVDTQNHTVEFRLPLEIDLSTYYGAEIFYGEGTGYATWMFPAQIRALFDQIRFDGSRNVTPFLAWAAQTMA